MISLIRRRFDNMEVEFRDICGLSYTLQIPTDAKVLDACKLLSEKTGVSDNQLFLISSDEGIHFYHDTKTIKDVLQENPNYIIFMKHFASTHKHNEQRKSSTPIQDLQPQKTELFLNPLPHKIFNSFQDIKCCQNHDIYNEYTSVLNEMPADFQERVNKIAELGYKLDDIKEALRITNYDVMVATHLLVLVNQHRPGDFIDDEYDSLDYDDDSEIEIDSYNNDERLNKNVNDDVKNNKSTDAIEVAKNIVNNDDLNDSTN